MHIHEVLLVPGYGHSSDQGEYVRGRVGPDVPFSELDIIDLYLPAIVEELDCESIRHSVMPTRDGKGIKLSERFLCVEPNTLVVNCLVGWTASRRKEKNITAVTYGHQQALPIADEMSEAIGQWGQCLVFGHRTSNPRQDVQDKLLNVPETRSITIEPFALNGPDVDTYVRHLEKLGVCIARCIADHLNKRGQAKVGGLQLAPDPSPPKLVDYRS